VSTALYRRYRPETFADVIGQEHVTEPLMQALRTGRVNHAYLFSGPRGCGKTTSARILARCLNCEEGPTPTPCGTCDSCVALARGGPGTVDVIEIDAASHGGVDDARDLRERASYGPAQSRYKIYIIDEAHMVTPQGFNALLKIVEEPPEHVKFVFATTEPEKVIGTIRSRTHHYPFRLVPPDPLTDYLEDLAAKEGVAVAPGVMSFVVRAGGGSVRDSLSVLDQLIAGSGSEGLTYESAAALLGFTDGELLDSAIDAYAAGDAAGAFRAVERVIETGLDPRRFIEDLLERLRDLIIVSAVPDGAAAVLRAVPADQLERMRTQAAAFGVGALTRAADVVNAGLTEMTGATSPRLQLELITARVLLPGAAGERGYAARLDRIERRLEVGGVPSAAAGETPVPSRQVSQPPVVTPPAAPTTAAAAGAAHSDPREAPERPAPEVQDDRAEATHAAPPVQFSEPGEAASATAPSAGADADASEEPPAPAAGPGAGGLDTAAIRRHWPDVLAKVFELKRVTWTFLSEHAQVLSYDSERLVLGIATSGLAETFRRGPHAEIVRQALIDALGVDVRVEGIPSDGSATEQTGPAAVVPGMGRRPGPAPASTAGRPNAPGTVAAGGAATGTPTTSGPTMGDPARGSGAQAAGGPDGPARPDGGLSGAAPAYDGGDDRRSWGSAPADPSTAPSWAGPTEDLGTVSPLERARREVQRASAEPPTRVIDDSAAAEDDEIVDDVESLGEVGVPVVERILGGVVIESTDTGHDPVRKA
jgi:DNA polymerase-3 subunit gamma/tau